MKLCALIGSDNTIAGIVKVEEDSQIQTIAKIYSQVIDITDYQPLPQIGWDFDGQQVVGTSVSKKITKLAMRQRFTVQEMLGIMNASLDPAKAIVKYLMDNLQVATFVDLARPDTQAGLQMLVSLGLLTQERATTILTTPPSVLEAYTA